MFRRAVEGKAQKLHRGCDYLYIRNPGGREAKKELTHDISNFAHATAYIPV